MQHSTIFFFGKNTAKILQPEETHHMYQETTSTATINRSGVIANVQRNN
jgi:hypothetical protein